MPLMYQLLLRMIFKILLIQLELRPLNLLRLLLHQRPLLLHQRPQLLQKLNCKLFTTQKLRKTAQPLHTETTLIGFNM